MIARGAPIGAVCLRCRLQLLRQLTPVRYVASDASNTHRPDDLVSDRTDGDDVVRNVDNDKSSEPKSRLHSGKRRFDFRKRHLSGNRVLNERAARLGTDMLGKPAYAIVMRDGGKVKRREISLVPSEDETKPESSAAIEALVDSQREPPTLAEVRSSIQNLRPKIDKVLSEKEFRKLQRLLANGFLSAQLQDYREWLRSEAKRESQEDTTDNSSAPEFSWIRERSPWAPLQTQTSVKSNDLTLRGYVLPTTLPKEIFVIRLMREDWGLSIAELETQLGEIQIKLRNQELLTLMRGTRRFTNTLGKIWLEPGEKIEVFRTQMILRLVATKHKADSIIKDLDETLKSVTNRRFPVDLVASRTPNDAELEELGRITNTHIRSVRGSKMLDVTWIRLDPEASRDIRPVENMAHIVFRLLHTALRPQQATTTTLLSPIMSQEHSGRLIVDVTSKDKLAWRDRLAQWARFVHPLKPEEESVANPTLPIHEFELPFKPIIRTEPYQETEPLKEVEPLQETESPQEVEEAELLQEAEPIKENIEFSPETELPVYPAKWSNMPQTSTVACFGQVLHPYQSSNPTPLLSNLLASTDRRLFAPTTPHPLHLSKFGASDSNSTSPQITTKFRLVLRFWPCPASPPFALTPKATRRAKDAPLPPILELRLAASDREVRGVESLRAITRTHHADMMLPSSLVDVRFTQTQYETLQASNPKALAEWQPLADFLRYSHLDLENGKLDVQPHQRFLIPRRLLATTKKEKKKNTTKTEKKDTTKKEKKKDTTKKEKKKDTSKSTNRRKSQVQSEDPDELVDESYNFVGLELHRSVTLPYEGHQLTYTSIEAGQGGGRRAEVTLEPVEPLHSAMPATEAADKGALQEDFLECCSRLVADRSLWSGVPDLKH